MTRILISTLLVGATLLITGCANSVLNDPEEMAKRRAEVAQNQAGWDKFWGGGSSVGGSSTASSSTGSNSSSSSSLKTYEPRRCYQTSNTHQTCFD